VSPVHTEQPEEFKKLFENVEAHGDNEWWDV
jgi:hypothetical protein